MGHHNISAPDLKTISQIWIVGQAVYQKPRQTDSSMIKTKGQEVF